MRVLVIEDDSEMRGFLREHLPREGFAVDAVGTGREGIAFAGQNEYDLVLLDLNLPDMTGESVVVALHERSDTAAILMLTITSDAQSKARLLWAGADDYLEKPFSYEELVARMRALLRRARTYAPDILTIGDITINVRTQRATRGQEFLPLTRKEFGILAYLARNHGEFVSKETLVEHIWNNSSDPFSNAIETHITNLRKKLGNPAFIHTEYGRGYMVD